ncbi:Armadillo repeat-containing protein 7 [Halocaridina rubra]|uniref:Armadillo repeat-containing protein 7 n=1 Tax=Halocaridina rubra TaxID=373956 RepID=A0AAN8WQC5_HALRR
MSSFFKFSSKFLFYPLLGCHWNIQTRSFTSFKEGDTVTLAKKITQEDVEKFAKLSGDTNPIHIDRVYVKNRTNFDDCVVHGALLNGLVSGVIGTRLPGPGTLVVKQELNFPSPCYVGEEVNLTVRLRELRKIVTVDFSCVTDSGKIVLWGNCKLRLQRL